MQKIEEKFSLIYRYMGIPSEEIRMDASYVKDFEFEEFQLDYLVFYIGSYFRINLRESDYPELETVGSSINFVRRKLKKRDRLKISRRKIRPIETLKSIPMIVRNSANKNLINKHLSYCPLTLSEVYSKI